ncbi:MAG: bifunctional tetrahydrofolate synthase/dihydrofolate synthase [Lysobacterales bacterium]
MSPSAPPRTLDDWLQLLEVRHPVAIDLGLERCREVWRRMGSPRPARSLFLVAGTNGKGSTVATICGALDGLGYRYGSYTSPHLYCYNERIQLQGEAVADALLLEAFERVEAARGETSLSYFEFGTLAAFSILSMAALDFAVLEIGLGGRLDAVNLLDADCAVITPIGLDHQEYLGSDLLAIGREKAGIIRAGRPLICGEQHPPASVLQTAAALDAPVKRFGREFRAELRAGLQAGLQNGAGDDTVRFSAGDLTLDLPPPALPGPHQLANQATGVAAVLELLPTAATDLQGLRRGLRSVRLPGRFEQVAERPALWIDVGHNPLAARVVAAALDELLSDGRIGRCRCVLAMLADKDAAGAVTELRGRVSAWYCAGTPGSRGLGAAQLVDRIRDAAAGAPIRAFPGVAEALDAALADSQPEDGVLVFGSFLTAAAAGRHHQQGAKKGPDTI